MVYFRFVIVAFIWTMVVAEELDPFSDEFIDLINKKNTTWKAGRNFPVGTDLHFISKLKSLDHNREMIQLLPKRRYSSKLIEKLPRNFDARDKWGHCPTLTEIRDQGACASCWAVAAVGAMSDRLCIFSNATEQFHFSAYDVLSCCKKCGYKCFGGFSVAAWKYWIKHGIVSGGSYDSEQGCKPYEIEPCNHKLRGLKPCTDHAMVQQCENVCEIDYIYSYKDDKHFGKSLYTLSHGENQIRAEIYKNGPVEADFIVYYDFLNYISGVYKHVAGKKIGSHSVKILGWGVEGDTKYWLIANSWNTNWGDNGFFKMLRGKNHLGIESCIVAGEPKLKKK